ncbi:3-phytase [Hypoxylon sp. FL1284]|nr:3-phytase [Hypoxylon sp. FL1284]
MRSPAFASAFLATYAAATTVAALQVDLPILGRTSEVDSDFTAVVYDAERPLLVGNDGGASMGGFRFFDLVGGASLPEVKHETPGRTKLVSTVYGIGGRDLVVTIAQPDSYFRLYDASTAEQVGEPITRTLGDWSALCAWKSQDSGEQYLYLFGKHKAVHFLLRSRNSTYEIVEVQTFDTPVEASSCAVSLSAQSVYYSGDNSTVYNFDAAESTAPPQIDALGKADDDVAGLAAYIGLESDYLLVAQYDSIAVYNTSFALLGSMKLSEDEDIEVDGLNIYQAPIQSYPVGVMTYATKSDAGKGFAISSLEAAFDKLGLEPNTAYDPRETSNSSSISVRAECAFSGFSQNAASCSCFAGFEGANCTSFTCRNDCSAHGTCVRANVCECDEGWGGLYCAFKVVQPVAETDANGSDGDDPAIWISPTNRSESRIITTTKSEEGAGFGVFDISGKKLQTVTAGEPNNVDVIYNFQAGNRTIDLIYAACRADNTLCLFEITANGTLQSIAGGTPPTKPGYEVYGSCVYRSRKSGKQYLFVNAKTAEYLQYELSWSDDTLHTTLVRNFTGGSGGQVEGCVGDDANGWLFLGEEPRGLWRYGAEPDDEAEGTAIDTVGAGGHMYADVEGVTLVEGAAPDRGLVVVSQQGVSAFNVYRRGAPHEYVATFTIGDNVAAGVDGVTNTDGVAAVGAALGAAFPDGLVVTHDDANQLPGGGTSDEASFKLVSLGDVLGEELMQEIDRDWDPRAS